MQMGCVDDGRCRRRISDLCRSLYVCVCLCAHYVSLHLLSGCCSQFRYFANVYPHIMRVCVKEREQLMCQLLGCKRLATPAPSPAELLPLPPLLLQLPLAWLSP